MALFSLQKIASCAAGQQVYLRGFECYNRGYVVGLERSRGDVYAEIVTADVKGDNTSSLYHCEVCFGYDGTPAHAQCNCAVFEPSKGFCKHIVAMLVHKYYTDMVSGSPTPTTVRVASHHQHTDDIAARMIRRYTDSEAAHLTAQTVAPDVPVRLFPSLNISGQSAGLQFSVGTNKSYILRDLRAFAAAVQSHETVSYGKDLSFYHHPDNFAAEDRALLRFLIGQIPSVPRGAVGDHAIRSLALSPIALDAFFSLMKNRTISCYLQGYAHSLFVRRGDPSLTVTVKKTDHGFRFEHDEPLVTLSGNRRRYCIYGNDLFACSSAFSDRVGPFIDALQASHGRLFVAEKDMPDLCIGALKAVSDNVSFVGDVDHLDRYLPTPMTAEVYLDSPGGNVIAAKLLFCYGERRVTAFTDEQLDGVTRDTLSEHRLRLSVGQLFDRVDTYDGRLFLERDDIGIYHFMTEGLTALQTIADVFITDRVRAIGIAAAPRISVGVRMESDLLELSIASDTVDQAELEAILTSYREKRTYHRLKSGRFLSLSDPGLQGFFTLTEGLSINQRDLRSGNISLPTHRAFFLDGVLRDDPSIHLRRDEAFRRLIRDITAVADNAFSPPASLDTVLRNYQKTGFRWLKTMQQYGFGGILADDMGLGKTVQMISLLLDSKEQGETLPSLVVCPASLIFNWQNEFARFAPSLRIRPIVGDKDNRERALDDLSDVDVIITSYDLLKRDSNLYAPHRFAYHILDEAQYIKNASTKSARSNKAVHSKYRFALTGTPIENRLSELWSIFDFLMPDFLHSYPRFRERFERPIVRDNDKEALSRLDKLVSPFILRRLKKDVLRELPEKHESVVQVKLAGEQELLYAANVQQLRNELHSNGLSHNHITVLSMLTRLRQLCCSPSLCYEDYHGESVKIDACLELVHQAMDGGHKMLIFSQFTSLLDLLKERLNNENIPFFELRGSTPKEQRAALVDTFNTDNTPVFLISLKAGGTGLNLTGADVVIHFDPWWNISAQNQATDRAHRIGQTRTVHVYKLIAADTVEEKIMKMQERKQALANAVVHEGDGLLSGMTADDLLELLK